MFFMRKKRPAKKTPKQTTPTAARPGVKTRSWPGGAGAEAEAGTARAAGVVTATPSRVATITRTSIPHPSVALLSPPPPQQPPLGAPLESHRPDGVPARGAALAAQGVTSAAITHPPAAAATSTGHSLGLYEKRPQRHASWTLSGSRDQSRPLAADDSRILASSTPTPTSGREIAPETNRPSGPLSLRGGGSPPTPRDDAACRGPAGDFRLISGPAGGLPASTADSPARDPSSRHYSAHSPWRSNNFTPSTGEEHNNTDDVGGRGGGSGKGVAVTSAPSRPESERRLSGDWVSGVVLGSWNTKWLWGEAPQAPDRAPDRGALRGTPATGTEGSRPGRCSQNDTVNLLTPEPAHWSPCVFDSATSDLRHHHLLHHHPPYHHHHQQQQQHQQRDRFQSSPAPAHASSPSLPHGIYFLGGQGDGLESDPDRPRARSPAPSGVNPLKPRESQHPLSDSSDLVSSAGSYHRPVTTDALVTSHPQNSRGAKPEVPGGDVTYHHQQHHVVEPPSADQPVTSVVLEPSIILLNLADIRPPNMAISNFRVEFESESAYFRPGEALAGKVVMDVWAPTPIRYVEFSLQGRGTVRVFKDTSTFVEQPRHEVYLDKRIFLISPPEGAREMILNPGRYVSSFDYTLPDAIPPSVHQFDMGNGYVFDISYTAKANVCDNLRRRQTGGGGGAAPSSGRPGPADYVRIVKTTKRAFHVRPSEDWRSIPGAGEPVSHREQVLLFCSCSSEPTSVAIQLDKGVYPLGGAINVKVEVTMPKERPKQVRRIRAELEQRMTFSRDLIRKFRKVLISTQDEAVRYSPSHVVGSGFAMPVPPNMVPSYLPHCHILNITYHMKVTVQFRGLRGKLTVRLPLTIAPPDERDQHYFQEDGGELPLFSKPIMQFPYFSKSPRDSGVLSSSVESHGSMKNLLSQNNSLQASTSGSNGNPYPVATPPASPQRRINKDVTTKYRTGLRCCACCLLCCGFGIYSIND